MFIQKDLMCFLVRIRLTFYNPLIVVLIGVFLNQKSDLEALFRWYQLGIVMAEYVNKQDVPGME